MSKSNIKKSSKGFINYWLYHSINKQTSLGILYGLNFIFLITTVAFTLLAFIFGHIETLKPMLFTFSIVLCIIQIPSVVISSIYNNRDEYGKPFVFVAKRKHFIGYTSSLIDWLSWGVTAFLIYLSFQQL
jgi:hypothetical protein